MDLSRVLLRRLMCVQHRDMLAAVITTMSSCRILLQ
jgi:hypothetical protein